MGIGNGILADAVYAADAPGLIYGGTAQFIAQLAGVILSFIWAFGIAFIVFKLLDAILGLRVSEAHEIQGLDISEHGVNAYPEYIIE